MATASGAGEALPAFARVTWGPAVAGGRRGASRVAVHIPSGREQQERLTRDRRSHTAEYFPLFELRPPITPPAAAPANTPAIPAS
jgi:hypothetical protein